MHLSMENMAAVGEYYALMGYYAENSGNYRRFGTTYRHNHLDP